ncbi:hypothetical protein [Myxococcus sp. RHSTA-1-4]|uniref:hypothetical protein n=1 Tax=Myxococcus sp. RHSTA-1-4 TaxID=2874601 RepID=UPI001CBB61C1|nr:hypothetical protein [Myxococcus sp. RHSTA-1-4]MBZ4421905.1 hypothetical protein [Myxococcus sp. RHSTA-1-4]
MDQPGEWIVGNHQLRFEPPDILWTTVRGWITAEDAPKWVDIIREVSAAGPVYCVVLMTPMPDFPYPRLSQEARQYLARNSNSDWLKGMVFVGGGLLQRITAKGLTVAMLLSGRKRFDVEFVDNLEQAQRWLDRHRAFTPH